MFSIHKSVDGLIGSLLTQVGIESAYPDLYNYIIRNHTMELLELTELNIPSAHDLFIIKCISENMQINSIEYRQDCYEKILALYKSRKN